MSTMSLSSALPSKTDDQGLWPAIRNRSGAIDFDRYAAFIEAVFCGPGDPTGCARVDNSLVRQQKVLSKMGHGSNAFEALRVATETFLILNCGVYIHDGSAPPAKAGKVVYKKASTAPEDCCADETCRDAGNLGSGEGSLLKEGTDKEVAEESSRLPNRDEVLNVGTLTDLLDNYLGGPSKSLLPYLDDVIAGLASSGAATDETCTPLCTGLLKSRTHCPCMIELIWSYWVESSGMVQAVKAIALRFQNKKACGGRDPLADLDIDPLRPLGNLIWGYIQTEHNRLTVLRRAYEYDHHYGITIKGKAVPPLCSADSRSKFLEGFHHLMRAAVDYYKAAEDVTKIPDGFPLLNALKEVHLVLAEGAGNQYGDLPWQARSEMLMEQWLLARTETREFLGGRTMVPYPAAWMGRIDAMRKLQGWGDTSVRYFYDLAIFGERLLLSVRFGNWSAATDENQAKNWANYWRQEIQGYIHAYRVATGVDLSDTKAQSDAISRMTTSPADLIVPSNGVRVSPSNGRFRSQ